MEIWWRWSAAWSTPCPQSDPANATPQAGTPSFSGCRCHTCPPVSSITYWAEKPFLLPGRWNNLSTFNAAETVFAHRCNPCKSWWKPFSHALLKLEDNNLYALPLWHKQSNLNKHFVSLLLILCKLCWNAVDVGVFRATLSAGRYGLCSD